jgi:phosphate transport system permease protein
MTNSAINPASGLSISPRLAKNVRRNIKERVIELLLMLAALSAVATTLAIVVILLYESLSFFKTVSIVDFLPIPNGRRYLTMRITALCR